MSVIYLIWNLIIITVFQTESALRLSLLLKYPLKKCEKQQQQQHLVCVLIFFNWEQFLKIMFI